MLALSEVNLIIIIGYCHKPDSLLSINGALYGYGNSRFITVKALVDLFIKQEHIINRLDMIKNQSINDWEKWLQLELEFFMRQHESIANVEREVPYLCDRRSAPDRFTMFVDLKFRKKSTLRLIHFSRIKMLTKPNCAD